jgi:hypothetical protein
LDLKSYTGFGQPLGTGNEKSSIIINADSIETMIREII